MQGNVASSKTGIVIFDSRYGNTEKIARAFEEGLRQAGIVTTCMNAKDVDPQSLQDYDLIAVGAPTEWLTASKPMKAFLEKFQNVDLSGKYGFAFETKLSRPLSGSAAKLIEKELKNSGLKIISKRESATAYLESGSTMGAYLKVGEIERFREIGKKVGLEFLRSQKVPAA